MTVDEFGREIPGPEYGGKWIAWDEAELHIVGCGATLRDAEAQALVAGVQEPVLELLPPSDRYFVGGV